MMNSKFNWALFLVSISLLTAGFVSKFSKSQTHSKQEYYPSGQIKQIGCLQNGCPIGSWVSFYENGNIQRVTHYSGLHDDNWTYAIGTGIEYHPNGKIKYRVHYFNPDAPDSNFNFVGLFPGVGAGKDFVLSNGEIYKGESRDSLGNVLVEPLPVFKSENQYKLPVKYLLNNEYLIDTFCFALGNDGWLHSVN